MGSVNGKIEMKLNTIEFMGDDGADVDIIYKDFYGSEPEYYDCDNQEKFEQLTSKLLEIDFISTISNSKNEKSLFKKFFHYDSTENPACYGNSWSYLTQASNGIMYNNYDYALGFKYYDTKTLVAIGLFQGTRKNKNNLYFHVIRPMGEWKSKALIKLCKKLREISGQPVYLKKLTIYQKNYFIEQGCRLIHDYPWHPEAISEDDTYPERIIDINKTLEFLNIPGKNELKDKFNRFYNRYNNNYEIIEYDFKDMFAAAWSIVNNFFKIKQEKYIDISSANDYFNMLTSLPLGKNGEDYFAGVIRIGNKNAAFYLAERLESHGTAGIYSNLALYKKFPYLSEFQLIHLFKLLQKGGIYYANLGGSETLGLDNFKMKFHPSKSEKMHWVVYD